MGSLLISFSRYWLSARLRGATGGARHQAVRFSVPDETAHRNVDSDIGSPLVCRTACCREDFRESFSVLYHSFQRSGLCPRNAAELRVLPYHLSPQTQVFVGEHQGKVCGTISLVLDEGTGLPLESVFGDSVQPIRDSGRRVAEFASLAIDPAYPQNKTKSFSQLTSTAVAFARHHGVDELLAAVHPRHARFYQRTMGFRCLSDVVPYAGVLDRPAVLIAVSINEVHRVDSRWQRWYGHSANANRASLERRGMSSADANYFTGFLTRCDGERAT